MTKVHMTLAYYNLSSPSVHFMMENLSSPILPFCDGKLLESGAGQMVYITLLPFSNCVISSNIPCTAVSGCDCFDGRWMGIVHWERRQRTERKSLTNDADVPHFVAKF